MPPDKLNIARGTTDPGYWVYNLNNVSDWNWFEIILAEKVYSSYGLNTLGPLCLWQCFLISCDIFKQNAISIFKRYFENDTIIAQRYIVKRYSEGCSCQWLSQTWPESFFHTCVFLEYVLKQKMASYATLHLVRFPNQLAFWKLVGRTNP